MPIQKPEIYFTKKDKQLLVLISKLLLESMDKDTKSNVPSDCADLSDEEAKKLISLLSQLINSKDFYESIALINGLKSLNSISGNGDDYYVEDGRTKKLLFATRRRRFNMSTIFFTSSKWNALKCRLGIEEYHEDSQTAKMTPDYFLKMEMRLFEELEVKEELRNYLITYAENNLNVVEDFQAKKIKPKEPFTMREGIKGMIENLKKEKLIKKVNLSSLAFWVSNSSVLFTTRDWTSAGVFSCMVSEAIKSIQPKQD